MEARLPQEKLVHSINTWSSRKSAKKQEILSLLGLLQHAAKVVHPGRTFMRRMFDTVMKVRELDQFVRLNREFQSDLQWWSLFLEKWNGVGFLAHLSFGSPSAVIQTDASGWWGCRAHYRNNWFQVPWPSTWTDTQIMIKELVPIVRACVV